MWHAQTGMHMRVLLRHVLTGMHMWVVGPKFGRAATLARSQVPPSSAPAAMAWAEVQKACSEVPVAQVKVPTA
jgi:hypothetical protein